MEPHRPAAGRSEPGERAFPSEALVPYFRGARFAAISLGARVPEAKDAADRPVEQSDRYIESGQALAAA